MQNTLLTLGIVLILALVAALVGPAVVDWEQYHAEVEQQASAIVGVPVRVNGAIDVRLLPTPSVTLGDVEIGDPGPGAGSLGNSSGKNSGKNSGNNSPGRIRSTVSARGLAMELALGNLMRGEFHANQVTLDRPEVRAGIDAAGALQVPGLALNFDPDRLAIDRLSITDGRLLLSDAASGRELAVADLGATGEVSSLIGPFRLEGAFTAAGGHYSYRISGGRRDDSGAMKIRLALVDSDRALDFQSDGTVWFDGAAPRFEGATVLAPLGDGAGTQWRFAAGEVKASPAAVAFGKLEMSRGPQARPLRLSGDARLTLGREPRLAATLQTRQIDVDRMVADGAGDRRPPVDTVRLLVDLLAAAGPPPLPVRAVVGADSVVVGGATVSALHGDVETDGSYGFIVHRFDMRAPGATQFSITGKLSLDPGQEEFSGPVSVDSGDPAVFSSWIEGRGGSAAPLAAVRGNGTVTLGRKRIAVDGFKAEIDHRTLQGRLAYRFAAAAAPARLEAALSGAEFDFDHAAAVASALFGATAFDRPGEVAVALDIGRASWAGVQASKAQAALSYDRSGLKIDRLAITDIGGAAIDASGRLDSIPGATPGSWRGALDLGVAAANVEGMAALADRFVPDWKLGDTLRRWGPRTTPFKLAGRLEVEPQAAGRTAGKLRLAGTVAGSTAALEASGAGDLADPLAAAVTVNGKLDSPDGRALAGLAGLDAVATADARPARLTFSVDGGAGKTFTVDGRFAAPDLNTSVRGTMTAANQGAFVVEFRAANTRLPRRAGSPAVAADVRGRVAVNGPAVAIADLNGRVAGATVKGAVTLGIADPVRVTGEVSLDQADAGELFAILAGAPRAAAPQWSTEPFATPAAPAMDGRVAFRIGTAQWSPGAAAAKDVTGAIIFDPAGFALSGTAGTLAGGRFALDGELHRDRAGVSLHSRLKLTQADLPGLLGGVVRVASAGRLSLDIDVTGQGLSPASVVGSASGAGVLTVDNLEVGGLDPNAADTVLNALESDRGLTTNAPRLQQLAATALDAGRLRIATVATPVTVAGGSAQLAAVQTTTAQNSDFSGTMAIDLAGWEASGRFQMTPAPRKNAPGADRPVMTVTTRGPLAAARRSVDVTSLVTWATQRAIDLETRRLDDVEKERSRRMESTIDPLRRPDAVRPPEPPHPAGVMLPASPPPASAPPPPGTPAQGSDRRLRPAASSGSAPATGP